MRPTSSWGREKEVIVCVCGGDTGDTIDDRHTSYDDSGGGGHTGDRRQQRPGRDDRRTNVCRQPTDSEMGGKEGRSTNQHPVMTMVDGEEERTTDRRTKIWWGPTDGDDEEGVTNRRRRTRYGSLTGGEGTLLVVGVWERCRWSLFSSYTCNVIFGTEMA